MLTIPFLCLPLYLLLLSAQADSRTFGTLAGTAGGFVLANNVQGVSPWVAVPIGAVAGNYIASRYDKYKTSNHRPYRYNNSSYYDNPYDYGYTGGYYPGMALSRSTQSSSPRRPKPEKKIRSLPAVDLQPGIDLIKVSILNSNGLRTEIPILRIKEKFVGPQGEEYTALPTAEALAEIYGM